MVKKKEINPIDIVEKLSKELLELMGVTSEIEVSKDKENDAIVVDIKSNDATGLLIGSRGKTLASIQAVLGMMYKQKVGDWKRILVNIADWREKEEERLRSLALQVAQRAKTSNETQTLYNLNASQRRIVHMSLSEDSGVETESMGEGRDRYLLVRPKKV